MERRIYVLSVSIASVHRSIQRIKANALSEFGMNNIHSMCIYSIGTNPGISSTGICKENSIDKAAVSKAIKELISLGYISRISEGKRAYRTGIFLTQKGLNLFDIVNKKIEETSRLAFKDIDRKGYEETLHTLDTINKNLSIS